MPTYTDAANALAGKSPPNSTDDATNTESAAAATAAANETQINIQNASQNPFASQPVPGFDYNEASTSDLTSTTGGSSSHTPVNANDFVASMANLPPEEQQAVLAAFKHLMSPLANTPSVAPAAQQAASNQAEFQTAAGNPVLPASYGRTLPKTNEGWFEVMREKKGKAQPDANVPEAGLTGDTSGSVPTQDDHLSADKLEMNPKYFNHPSDIVPGVMLEINGQTSTLQQAMGTHHIPFMQDVKEGLAVVLNALGLTVDERVVIQTIHDPYGEKAKTRVHYIVQVGLAKLLQVTEERPIMYPDRHLVNLRNALFEGLLPNENFHAIPGLPLFMQKVNIRPLPINSPSDRLVGFLLIPPEFAVLGKYDIAGFQWLAARLYNAFREQLKAENKGESPIPQMSQVRLTNHFGVRPFFIHDKVTEKPRGRGSGSTKENWILAVAASSDDVGTKLVHLFQKHAMDPTTQMYREFDNLLIGTMNITFVPIPTENKHLNPVIEQVANMVQKMRSSHQFRKVEKLSRKLVDATMEEQQQLYEVLYESFLPSEISAIVPVFDYTAGIIPYKFIHPNTNLQQGPPANVARTKIAEVAPSLIPTFSTAPNATMAGIISANQIGSATPVFKQQASTVRAPRSSGRRSLDSASANILARIPTPSASTPLPGRRSGGSSPLNFPLTPLDSTPILLVPANSNHKCVYALYSQTFHWHENIGAWALWRNVAIAKLGMKGSQTKRCATIEEAVQLIRQFHQEFVFTGLRDMAPPDAPSTHTPAPPAQAQLATTTPAWSSSSPAQHLSGIDADFTILGAEDAPVDLTADDAPMHPVDAHQAHPAQASQAPAKSTVDEDNFFGILDDEDKDTPMATDPLVEKRKRVESPDRTMVSEVNAAVTAEESGGVSNNIVVPAPPASVNPAGVAFRFPDGASLPRIKQFLGRNPLGLQDQHIIVIHMITSRPATGHITVHVTVKSPQIQAHLISQFNGMQSTAPAVGPIHAAQPRHPHPPNIRLAITQAVFSPANNTATPRSLSCIFSGCSHCTNLTENTFSSVEECVDHHSRFHPELFSSLALPHNEDVRTKAKFSVCTKCFAHMTFTLDPWISHHDNCIGRDSLQHNLLPATIERLRSNLASQRSPSKPPAATRLRTQEFDPATVPRASSLEAAMQAYPTAFSVCPPASHQQLLQSISDASTPHSVQATACELFLAFNAKKDD